MGRDYPQGGVQQGEYALVDLARSPFTARRLAYRMLQHFVADDAGVGDFLCRTPEWGRLIGLNELSGKIMGPENFAVKAVSVGEGEIEPPPQFGSDGGEPHFFPTFP